MKISFDSEIDALYIRLIEGKHECRAVRLNEGIALNIGEGEKLVGIEILDAKEVLGAGKLPSVVLEGITLATAPRSLVHRLVVERKKIEGRLFQLCPVTRCDLVHVRELTTV